MKQCVVQVVSDIQEDGNDAVTTIMGKTAIPEPSGKPAASRFSADTGTIRVTDADAAIAPLLQRATILKMRSQWEEAVTVATDAVRRAPASAAAHALLGDIYAAQNKTDDALNWYGMALARDPQDSIVAQKHDLLLTQKRAAITGNFPSVALSRGTVSSTPPSKSKTQESRATEPTLTARLPLPSSTAERTLEWLDRVFPPGRSEGMARLLFTISGIVVALVAVTGLVLYINANKSDGDSDSSLSMGEIASVSRTTLPASVGSSTRTDVKDGASPAPQDSQAPTTVPQMASTLLKELAAAQNAELLVTSAQTDAQNTQVQLEIAVTAHPGEAASATRARILASATTVAQAAAAAKPSLQRFSVRVLLRTDSSHPGAAGSSLVFVGETSSTALQVVSKSAAGSNPTLLRSLFTNTWWSNTLSSAATL